MTLCSSNLPVSASAWSTTKTSGAERFSPEVDVHLVAVRAFGALHVAVGGWHRDGPLRAVRAGAAALATLGVLDCDVEALDLHVALAVVAALSLGGAGVGLDERFLLDDLRRGWWCRRAEGVSLRYSRPRRRR